MTAYRNQVESFRRKFGREMGPGDPFFFDPSSDTPQFRPPDDAEHAIEVLSELLAEAGLGPEYIFAFKRTGGLFPNAANPLTRDQQREWDAAVKEYYEQLRRSPRQ